MQERGLRNRACGIELSGLRAGGRVHYNLHAPDLYRESIQRGEAELSSDGALVAYTGQHTGRSPKDKFIVRDENTQAAVWWGGNSPMEPEAFERLHADFIAHAAERDLFVQDLVGGADPVQNLPVRVVTADCDAEVGSCPQDLTASWNHDGVATLDASAEGDFDGGGWSFPAEQLPAPGLSVLGERAYLMPSTTGTDPNFVEARGQDVPLTGGASPALDVVASAHHGDVDATATVTYADGSTADVPLRVTDWAAGGPRFGETLAVRTDYRVKAGTGRDAPPVALWHTVVPLDASKDPVSLTLPDDPRLEIYALSARNGSG